MQTIVNARSYPAAAPNYQLMVTLNNLSTPHYRSDIVEEPAEDEEKVARFKEAELRFNESLSVAFPIGESPSPPVPPEGVKQLLYYLTGWTLRYFSVVEELCSKNRHIGRKKFGSAHVMLWEKEIEENGIKKRGSQVTFRLHEGSRETGNLWFSGSVNASTTISYSSDSKAVITINNKRRGSLINITKMSAIASKAENNNNSQGIHTQSAAEGNSTLVLTFRDGRRYCLDFVSTIERFKDAAALVAPLTPVPSFNGSVNLIG